MRERRSRSNHHQIKFTRKIFGEGEFVYLDKSTEYGSEAANIIRDKKTGKIWYTRYFLLSPYEMIQTTDQVEISEEEYQELKHSVGIFD